MASTSLTSSIFRVYNDMTTLCKMFCLDDLKQEMKSLKDKKVAIEGKNAKEATPNKKDLEGGGYDKMEEK